MLGEVLGTDTPDEDTPDEDTPDEDTPDEDASAEVGTGDAPVSGADVVEESGAIAEEPAEAVESGATAVTLLEKNSSGVTGDASIDAERVVATASGLDPAERYVSFFYGATSSATNNNPCILDGTNPLPGEQTVGEWDVDADGSGTLSAPNPLGERYTLQAGTMSIRQVEHDFSTATALPVNPLSYSLVACGEVERLEVLDPVYDLLPKIPALPSVPAPVLTGAPELAWSGRLPAIEGRAGPAGCASSGPSRASGRGDRDRMHAAAVRSAMMCSGS